MENEVLETASAVGFEVSTELTKKIATKVAEIKAKDPKIKKVYPIVIEGDADDDKTEYIGYFRQPSFAAFSKFLSASSTNQAVAMRTLAKDCFLDGDIELVEEDSLFLFGLMGHLSQIINVRHGKLVNLSNPGK